MQKWTECDRPLAERLFAFIVIEGVLFCSSFCSIFWLKSRGLMVHGLGFTNALISRDEGLHTQFGILLYSKLANKLSQERIEEILAEAVDLESEFVTDSIPVELIGMNSRLMTQYIKFVGDYTLKSMGYKPVYEVENPFPFMD